MNIAYILMHYDVQHFILHDYKGVSLPWFVDWRILSHVLREDLVGTPESLMPTSSTLHVGA